MKEMFDQIFYEVMKEKHIKNWWKLFDSDEFDEVEKLITKKLRSDCWNNKAFKEWYKEMANDL